MEGSNLIPDESDTIAVVEPEKISIVGGIEMAKFDPRLPKVTTK